ncbi:hypothetical protein BDW02DRAFT_578802 [Decorospora gaudefroyi]|uniref:Pentatricopeptide repeat protein n=1 Tax=Decorospora gaudefroyi TaxID=184978 RepID=A0A6A5KBW1_9PLEO|nr:hypothetical protein BDW02DRAFT_578802 [Decorospora gaudefroyi]
MGGSVVKLRKRTQRNVGAVDTEAHVISVVDGKGDGRGDVNTVTPNLVKLPTLPRKIPSYLKKWDPTLCKPSGPPAARIERSKTDEVLLHDTTETQERREFGDAHTLVTISEDNSVGEHHTVKRLNSILRLASDTHGRDASLQNRLWRAYTSGKASDPGIVHRLPDRAWDILWNSQSLETPDDCDRRPYLEQLCRDMELVGKNTTIAQRIEYLENVFLSGKEEQALKGWEEDRRVGLNGVPQDYKPEHLEIGAKLHALAGNVDRSRFIMEELFTLYPNWNASVMMTVFRAHTSSGTREHHEFAQQIYVTMKERKGETLSIEDYDAWFVGFLEARDLSYAKRVLRDMIKEGFLDPSGTIERVEQVLKRLNMLYRLGTDISKMTSIALDAISVLPPAYHGRLFGDWMKSAVVEKAPEAAAQIMESMFKRGYKPETFHFNMLLKALLRTKEQPKIMKAENIGWRMIGRVRKVHQQKLKSDTAAEVIDARSSRTDNVDAGGARTVPPANQATFALIMQHHAERLQWEHVDYLVRKLKQTAVPPNDAIMNVLIDNKCRQGAYSEACGIYKTLTNPQEGSTGIFPNGTTFRHLWKTLRLALGDPFTRNDPNLPTPRELLKEMVTWWTLCRSRYDAKRFRQGLAAADSGAITALIMHCFSYTQDPAGSLIALHILRQNFDIFPTDNVAEILQQQLVWEDIARESESVRAQYFHSRYNKRNRQQITKVFDLLLQRRLERMGLQDDEYDKFTDEQIGDVGLNLLSEFVRVVLKRNYPPEVVEAMLEAAKCAVGVPELSTGDMDAFEVA